MRPKPKPRLLNTSRITVAAFALLNEQGLHAFSLRTLASRLDVHVSALYRHFENKDALLLHLTRTMLDDQPLAMPKNEKATWQEWLLASAHSLRNALLTYRDGPQLCVAYHQQIDSAHSRALFHALHVQGFTHRDASYCVSTLTNFIIGFTLEEEYERSHLNDERPEIANRPLSVNVSAPARTADIEFAYSLELFINGIDATVKRM
ncbi:TetR/AcrR family transcriptional regulator C-terminal domain-containing protein [Cohnella zeiphila]|uniref:TetR/AcrR family transcriptional regulator C-terminal domain-containing protein n=1 Tax=Cohnella zeiphila TaxID=2761120 RepID=A0A7X0SPP5_9BACL|nr:TetR/AcrR family transcriptional regulator C-terminal domain-containing protein [Cohnella zeiphila]MBB6733801.1 TetR/AcrR family transcriptional regulator C-terminal domain-containing protein [Cohnella zeiphila]